MFTVKIMHVRPQLRPSAPDGQPQPTEILMELIEARDVTVIQREPGMFVEIVGTAADHTPFSYGVRNPDRLQPDNPSYLEASAGYEAYIENAAGATTEVIRF